MHYSISIDEDLRAILLTTQGDLTAEDFQSMIEASDAASRKSGFKRMIVDHTHGSIHQLTYEDIVAIAKIAALMNGSFQGGRLAVVIRHDRDFDMGQIWRAHALKYLHYDSQIFRTRLEAVQWLLRGLAP